jgi:hypothetical protein
LSFESHSFSFGGRQIFECLPAGVNIGLRGNPFPVDSQQGAIRCPRNYRGPR